MQQRQAEFLREKKLDIVLAESGYGSPLDLVEAFIRKFGLKITADNTFLRKRKRVRVTSELRDAIRKECAEGLSMNRASKKYGISYAVVSKILNGAYDGLQ
jgi:predicted Fe-Mo cluster-binding NifX family protein